MPYQITPRALTGLLFLITPPRAFDICIAQDPSQDHRCHKAIRRRDIHTAHRILDTLCSTRGLSPSELIEQLQQLAECTMCRKSGHRDPDAVLALALSWGRLLCKQFPDLVASPGVEAAQPPARKRKPRLSRLRNLFRSAFARRSSHKVAPQPPSASQHAALAPSGATRAPMVPRNPRVEPLWTQSRHFLLRGWPTMDEPSSPAPRAAPAPSGCSRPSPSPRGLVFVPPPLEPGESSAPSHPPADTPASASQPPSIHDTVDSAARVPSGGYYQITSSFRTLISHYQQLHPEGFEEPPQHGTLQIRFTFLLPTRFDMVESAEDNALDREGASDGESVPDGESVLVWGNVLDWEDVSDGESVSDRGGVSDGGSVLIWGEVSDLGGGWGGSIGSYTSLHSEPTADIPILNLTVNLPSAFPPYPHSPVLTPLLAPVLSPSDPPPLNLEAPSLHTLAALLAALLAAPSLESLLSSTSLLSLPPYPLCCSSIARRHCIDALCPICSLPMTNDLLVDIVWCKTQCGQSVHAKCMDTWLEYGNTCVVCRTKWAEPCPHDLTVRPPSSFWAEPAGTWGLRRLFDGGKYGGIWDDGPEGKWQASLRRCFGVG
ncbi:hypothetical protein P152DRAFT_475319 [Eremomyces bilateralis CBS 781.70]|uniref:RING-type domain-containing protein n=1 Tax=Eremomyces bilateralis CBS 781.70 TaxID=1392243 RepID=A0A6G1FYE6_9PEZI|nr:uncharacterized protein P152DRAFT_475319 [Eremomyces bilateralis CBS 781.70]KAF1810867.1 hypothetical protein P152DRAFT_475319 [Eremomyces bilateralis CBS 781.70]